MMEYPTAEQRSSPNFCAYYARRTPMIPYHNGQYTYGVLRANGTVEIVRKPCLGCRKTREDGACDKCANMPADYRTPTHHLAMATDGVLPSGQSAIGSTILEPHVWKLTDRV